MEEPGAQKARIDGIPLIAMMVLGYVDALPETREAFTADENLRRGRSAVSVISNGRPTDILGLS